MQTCNNMYKLRSGFNLSSWLHRSKILVLSIIYCGFFAANKTTMLPKQGSALKQLALSHIRRDSLASQDHQSTSK